MAYLERKRIHTESDLDDNTTWRYKMPSMGKYTAIEMRINCDRYNTRAAGGEVHPLESCISKVELLKKAGEVVISLPGQQLDAMNYWDLKKPNARRYRQEADTGNEVVLFLLGGRGFYDKEFGFDFAKLGETFLEYTYDLNEGDAEYFKASDHDIRLYGYKWLGPGEPTFRGYFRSRQLSAWTTSAEDAIKTIHIPIGRNIRRVAVQAKTRDATIGGIFSELELQANEGEFSPVLIKSPFDWCMAEVSEYGLENQVGGIDYLVSTSEMDLPYWWSYIESLDACPYGYAGAIDVNVHGITIPARIAAAATGAVECMFISRGWGFQKCLRIGFDHEYDLTDILPTADLGALDLICTEAAADKAAACFYQDVVLY